MFCAFAFLHFCRLDIKVLEFHSNKNFIIIIIIINIYFHSSFHLLPPNPSRHHPSAFAHLKNLKVKSAKVQKCKTSWCVGCPIINGSNSIPFLTPSNSKTQTSLVLVIWLNEKVQIHNLKGDFSFLRNNSHFLFVPLPP